MPNLEYVLVITDQGTATIKKVNVAIQGLTQTSAAAVNQINRMWGVSQTSASASAQAAKMAGVAVGQVGQAAKMAGTAIHGMGVTGVAMGGQVGGGAKAAVGQLTQMDRTLQRLQRTAMAFFGMWVLTKAISLPKEIISTVMEFNSEIETAKLGIASILMAQGEFTNAVMGTVQGYGKLVVAQQMSGEIVKKLQIDNLRTIATFDQLVKAFQSTLAPALEKGFNVEQIRQFTVAMVQAAGAMGLNLDMLAEETRSLLRGVISPRQTLIATALGITNEDIRRYQGNADALYSYIMGRLSAFTVAGMESQKTWLGLTSNLKDMVKIVLGAGLDNIFKLAKREAQALMDAVITVNEKTGEMEINPDVLESLKRLAYLFEAAYFTVKDIALIIGELRVPVDLLAEAWRSISISAEAWQRAVGGGKAKTAKEGYVSILGVTPKIQEPEWFGKYRGKGMIESMTMGLKDFNDYISGTGKRAIKEYMDYYQRQMEVGTTFAARQRGLREDEINYLLKVASEIGYINEKLNEQFKADMAIKGINIDLTSYSGKQLQAVIKTAEEYSKLKDTGKETEEAFTKLLAVRLRIAAIETAEAPMKIVQQLAQSTDQYGEQEKIVIKLNQFALEKLRLTSQLTPELKKQMEAQTAFSIAEIDRTKRLGELERQRDIVGLQQKYAQITGDIEGQLQSMKELTDIEIENLRIQIERTANLDKILDLTEKINKTQKVGTKEREQFRITGGIQQRQPFYVAGIGLAEATGNAQAYERISRLVLEDEIKSLKVTQEMNPYLKDIITLKTKQWEIDNAIRMVEMETYGGDIVARAKANYSSITSDMVTQSEASQLLLDNEVKRTVANSKLSADQAAILVYYLKQIEASETINRNLTKQKEILGWQQQLASLQGEYIKNKELEIELLEKDRELLLEVNSANWDSVKAINAYYDKLVEVAEARKELNVLALIELGGQQAVKKAQEDLADMYEDILPNAVGIFVDSIKDMDGSSKKLFANWQLGFTNLLKDIAFAILKMEILKALMGGKGEEGKGGLVGLLKGVAGTVAGGVGGLFSTPGTTTFTDLSPGVSGWQHGGIIYKPTLGWVGEKGPEAVIPLDKLNRGGGGFSVNMPITVNGSMSDKDARSLRDETEQFVIERLRYYSR
jgi:hypothetical protein